jgi:hypothetical protein
MHTTSATEQAASCPSCGASVSGNFCAYCGERRPHRLAWHALAEGAVEHLLHFDTPFLRTVAALTRRPGPMVREYLLGSRRRYLDPVRYVLVVATVMLIAWHLVDRGEPQDVPPDVMMQLRIFRTIMRFYGYYLFAVLLPVALVQVCFFRRQGWRFVEVYAFDLFVFGHILWLNVMGNSLGAGMQTPGGMVVLALQVVAVVAAVRGFYGTTTLRAVPLGLLLFAVYLTGLAAAGFATFGVYATLPQH